MIWLTGIWTRFYGYIIAAGAVIAAVLTIFYRGKAAGKSEAVTKSLEKQAENVRIAHEIENQNRAALRDGDAATRLLEKWSRRE